MTRIHVDDLIQYVTDMVCDEEAVEEHHRFMSVARQLQPKNKLQMIRFSAAAHDAILREACRPPPVRGQD